MKKLLITRKYNKEVYTYFLHTFNGEKGIFGIPQNDYVTCETPDNGLGYIDIVQLSTPQKKAYTMHRYLQPYIKKQIEKKLIELENKYL